MKNKNILYGLLGAGALAGGYFFYKKFINSSGTYPLEVNKVSNNLVRVDVFKDNTDKILYSTFVSKRDLKNNGSYFGTLFENASFKLTEEQRTDGITHYFIFELYDSKGNRQQRFPFYLRLQE